MDFFRSQIIRRRTFCLRRLFVKTDCICSNTTKLFELRYFLKIIASPMRSSYIC